MNTLQRFSRRCVLRNRPTAGLVDWAADLDDVVLIVVERAGDRRVAHRADWCAPDLCPAAGLLDLVHGAIAREWGG